MTLHKTIRSGLAAGLFLFAAVPVYATDGHFLHGVGAVNSAMGGAAVAVSGDLLASLYVNPAGLAGLDGTRIALGFELFKPDRTVKSTMGPLSGSTKSKSDFVPVPSFGWSMQVSPKLVVGLGALGVGGFGVDYPADPTNPILTPRPNGFGQVTSNFSLLKIAPALAYAVTDRVKVGIAANLDWASLSVDPMPVAAPAVGSNGPYYSRGTAADGAFGIGFQAGLILDVLPNLSIGASYASEQSFQDFEFNAMYENPSLPTFGTPRTIKFALDVPSVTTAGVALKLGRAFTLAGDAKYITYESTAGFAEEGFGNDFSVQGFGWKNIWAFAGGIQYRPIPAVALRGGYNFSQNPIPDELALFNVPAPAVVQHHVTFGLGITPFPAFSVDAGFYHAFSNSIDGPMYGPTGPIAGTSVKSTLQETSFLVQFAFTVPQARQIASR